MVKASIEVVKNVDGRVESGVVIVQGRKLRFNNVWDDDGLLRRIEFDGRYIPTFSELYLFMNEKFIERIRKIDVVDELTLLKTINSILEILNIVNVANVANIAKIESIESAQIMINPIRNSGFVNGFEGWINPTGNAVTRVADDLNRFEIAVKFDHAAAYLVQNLFVNSDEYSQLAFWAYKPAVGGADLRLFLYYTDGTSDNYVPALTNAWARYSKTLLAGKILSDVQFRDMVGICYLAMPMLVKGTTVSATDLDIRNLTSASDSVAAFTKHDNKTYKTAVFDANASGNLVAAVAAKVIKLHALTIQAQGTVAVNLNNGSGGSSLMEWSFQAREGAVIPMANAPAYWAVTGVNTALYVTLSAAVVVTITAIYSDDDAA